MRYYLGVDGGGTKTAFVLIDADGRVLATHTAGPAYYFEVGLDTVRAMLATGIEAVCRQAGLAPAALDYSFLGLPAYGEDSSLLGTLDAMASPLLASARYRCGNDAQCGFAGALAGGDGINVVAGTGSIAYGEHRGRVARSGGWGELFGDEASAYWVAREGLTLFARMSDGREPMGPLHAVLKRHFGLAADLDLVAAIYGAGTQARSKLAELSVPIANAAKDGDPAARAIFLRAGGQLVDLVEAVRAGLAIADGAPVTVSYSGGMFALEDLLLAPFRRALAARSAGYRLQAPHFPPAVGAALYAARLAGTPLAAPALAALGREQAPAA